MSTTTPPSRFGFSNPFSNTPPSTPPPVTATPPPQQSAPANGSGSSGWGTWNPFAQQQQQEATLQTQREAELARREAELAQREAALNVQQRQGGQGAKRKNFPICWPVMVHDIEHDIPAQSRAFARWLYRAYMTTLALLLWNAIACFAILVTNSSSTGATDFGVSLVYGFGVALLSLFLWYRPAYYAMQKGSSFYYQLYFAFNMCHIFYSFYMGLGIQGTGSAGAILTISLFASSHIVPGIMSAISTVLWFLTAAWFLVLYKKIHGVYRTGGHSVEEARNEAVRKAAGAGLIGAYLKSGPGGSF